MQVLPYHKFDRDGNSYVLNVERVIARLAAGYFKTIRENVERYDNLTVLVFNVVPPTRYKEPSKHFWTGDDAARRWYVQLMNEALSYCCDEYGYLFVDIFVASAAEDGFLSPELSDRKTHVIDPAALEAWLQANLVEKVRNDG